MMSNFGLEVAGSDAPAAFGAPMTSDLEEVTPLPDTPTYRTVRNILSSYFKMRRTAPEAKGDKRVF